MMKSIFVSVLVSVAFAAQVAQADVYADALASPSRLEADAARDAGRNYRRTDQSGVAQYIVGVTVDHARQCAVYLVDIAGLVTTIDIACRGS